MTRRLACIAIISFAITSNQMCRAESGPFRIAGLSAADAPKIQLIEWTRVGDGRWSASPPYYGSDPNGSWSWNRQPFPHRFYSAYPPYYGPHYGTHPGPRAYRYYGGYYW